MFKRVRIYANDDAKDRDLSEASMMFMGIGGKEMTNLELLKREDHDLLAWKMMHNYQNDSLRGSGPPRVQTVPSRAQNTPMAAGKFETT